MDLHFLGPGAKDAPAGARVICPDKETRLAHPSAELVDDNFWIAPAESGVRRFALEHAGSWYKDGDGRDFTELGGISLGAVLEGQLWAMRLGPIAYFYYHAQRLFAVDGPGDVRAYTNLPAHRLESLDALCRRTGARLDLVEAGPAVESRSVSRCGTWPLNDRAGAQVLANRLLGALPRRGEYWLVSHYHTLEPLLGKIAADRAIAPVFYQWPGRRWPKLDHWWRWSCLEGDGSAAPFEPRLADITACWSSLRESRAYASRFEFRGESLWPQVRRVLDQIVAEDFPFLAERLTALRGALDRTPPRLVVVPFDANPPERLLLLEARRRGICTAVVLHGAPILPLNRLCDTQADHLLVGGQAYIDSYAAVGVPRERIHAVGLPFLDRYRVLKRRPRRGPARVTIVTTDQPIELNIGKVLDLLLAITGVEVVVKLHPGESEAIYREALAGRLNGRVRLISTVPLHEVLAESDFVLGGASTAMLEAMAMGIPALVTNLERTENAPPFDGKSGLDACDTLDELAAALERMLPDDLPETPDYAKLLEAYAGPADGKAAERAFEALKSAVR